MIQNNYLNLHFYNLVYREYKNLMYLYFYYLTKKNNNKILNLNLKKKCYLNMNI